MDELYFQFRECLSNVNQGINWESTGKPCKPVKEASDQPVFCIVFYKLHLNASTSERQLSKTGLELKALFTVAAVKLSRA